ncbi:olfactory receptor 14K1-like [Tachyglossus aculeatus]|uniref:olfactory receptor 14K1-like n=1 Tax=Tachyglossus aculeatus TaxID=9261 RepID=UPI0018F75A41|nr:olfactory receptor 14K1-like [Tachyglossus aculeatus]
MDDIEVQRLVQTELFQLVYLAILTGNLLIPAISALYRHLYNSMCFFLRLLSFSHLCLISVTVPKSILNSLTDPVRPHNDDDHSVAICHPLRFDLTMDRRACGQIAATSWLSRGLFGVLYSARTFTVNFCKSNVIQPFFFDVSSLLKISHSEMRIVVDISVAVALPYLKPVTDTPLTLDLLVSVLDSVVPLALNPLIYSLRNCDMKNAMGKLLGVIGSS